MEFIGALRDRVGPNMGILFDVGQEYRMGGIVQLGRALEPFNLYWLEAEGFDPDALLAARRRRGRGICHGEALIGRQAFRPFFEQHVTDVVMIETLTTASPRPARSPTSPRTTTRCSPHNYMSPLSNLVNAHLCAAMPNFEILEIDMDDVPWKWDLIDQKLDIHERRFIVPKRPGWGANVVEAEVAKHPVKGHARRIPVGDGARGLGAATDPGKHPCPARSPAAAGRPTIDTDRAMRMIASTFGPPGRVEGERGRALRGSDLVAR